MYLFDTNILSEVLKKKPNSRLIDRLLAVPRKEQFTSTICLMEMRSGAFRRPDGEMFWKKISEAIFSKVTLLPVDEKVALQGGDLWALLSKKGRGVSFPDLLIGATALAHRCILVTANVRHFQDMMDIKIENWLVEA